MGKRKTMKSDNKLNIKWKMQTKYLHTIFELFSCLTAEREEERDEDEVNRFEKYSKQGKKCPQQFTKWQDELKN